MTPTTTTTTAADPEACPAAPPTPAWLGDLAAALHERLPPDAGDDWARRLYGLLGTRAPVAGLAVLHTWHCRTVLPLLAEQVRDDDPGAFEPLGDLHRTAALGTPVAGETWSAVLAPALLRVYGAAYDRAGAYTEAHLNARDHALANGFSPADAEAYGHAYARLSSDANATAFAEAHAEALGPALAHAYATDDGQAYADTFPGSQLRAVIRAATPPEEAAEHVVERLAEGLLTALADGPPVPHTSDLDRSS
ncbi:hypothetical protein [Streptomyces sp. NPDC006739]|uniref:hypothetical protein n=1 Tax=Streptomyces sp. NPDC006739 TaxID=3364763 RepID=UPI0036CB1563